MKDNSHPDSRIIQNDANLVKFRCSFELDRLVLIFLVFFLLCLVPYELHYCSVISCICQSDISIHISFVAYGYFYMPLSDVALEAFLDMSRLLSPRVVRLSFIGDGNQVTWGLNNCWMILIPYCILTKHIFLIIVLVKNILRSLWFTCHCWHILDAA